MDIRWDFEEAYDKFKQAYETFNLGIHTQSFNLPVSVFVLTLTGPCEGT